MPDLIGGKRVFGIAGWKDSGKTTLVTRLLTHFSSRGLVVSTLKHAHHAFDVDHEGTDSYRHREAGASQVAIVSDNRSAIMTSHSHHAKPGFENILSRMAQVDLVLVEGYKREAHPKLAVVTGITASPIWETSESYVAVACDEKLDGCSLPSFARDDVSAIANYILAYWQIDKGSLA